MIVRTFTRDSGWRKNIIMHVEVVIDLNQVVQIVGIQNWSFLLLFLLKKLLLDLLLNQRECCTYRRIRTRSVLSRRWVFLGDWRTRVLLLLCGLNTRDRVTGEFTLSRLSLDWLITARTLMFGVTFSLRCPRSSVLLVFLILFILLIFFVFFIFFIFTILLFFLLFVLFIFPRWTWGWPRFLILILWNWQASTSTTISINWILKLLWILVHRILYLLFLL